MNALRIGLLGLGTVGGGTFEVLDRNHDEIVRRAGSGEDLGDLHDLREVTR